MTDYLSPASPVASSQVPVVDTVPATEASVEALKKPSKVRSAWIGFAGRVTAQLIGAIATVGLGYAVMANHAAKQAQAAAVATPVAAQGSREAASPAPARHRRASGPTLAVLPFEDFSPTATGTSLVDGVTEAVTAALARQGRVHVTSRTSAMHMRKAPAPLRDIAATLGVDVVVEGSVVRHGNRVRVTAQLIDAATDAHVWAQTYDRQLRDVLDFEREIGVAITRDLASVLPRHLQTPPGTTATAAAEVPAPQPSARAAF